MDKLTKALKEAKLLHPELTAGQILLRSLPDNLDLESVKDNELAFFLEVHNKSFKLEGGDEDEIEKEMKGIERKYRRFERIPT